VFVDSHCHLDFPDFAGQLPLLLERMRAARVGGALCISVTLTDLPAVLALAENHRQLWATVGVHPDYPISTNRCRHAGRLAQHPQSVPSAKPGSTNIG
jgi:TatD DNase family protein